MSDGVYTLTDELITDHIRDAIPGKVSAKNINRLFDGTWHVQTYGEASEKLSLTVYAAIAGVKTLNTAEAEGQLLKIKALGDDWIGAIEDEIGWSESAPGYYQGSFVLILIDPEA